MACRGKSDGASDGVMMTVHRNNAKACDLRLATCARGSRIHRRFAPETAGRKTRALARGAVLLEVLIALALLIFGLAVVGMQVNKGLDAARAADIGTKGVMLAETKMAELNSGVIVPQDNNDEIKGDFGMLYPGYTWRFKFQPTEVNDFLSVELDIGYSAKQAKMQLDNPDQRLDFDDEGVRVVENVYRLAPIPADVNFERDFGFSKADFDKAQEQADQNGAGGGAATGGGGGGQAGGMDMSQLIALLGPLLAGGSFDPRMIANLPAEQLAQIQPFLQSLLGTGKVDAKGPLENLVQGGGGGRGRFGRGPRGDRNGNGPPGENGGNQNGANGNNGSNGSNNNGDDTGRTRTRRNPNDSGQGNGSNTNGGNGGNDGGNGNSGNGTRRGRTRNQNNSNDSGSNGSNGNGNGSNGNNGNGNGNNGNRNSGQGGNGTRRSGRNPGGN